MRVIIDSELCTGCELCVNSCPDLFKMKDDLARVIVDIVPEGAADCARQSVDDCPANAIKIED